MILSPATAKTLALLIKRQPDFLKSFYLTGGTALALQIGHRESEDLDFFSPKSFEPIKIEQSLSQYGKLSQTKLDKGTLNTYLNGVKLQFLEYPYPLIKPTTKWGSISLSSVEDIAATKIQTIGMRGSKKDFVDLYFLLKQFTLPDLFALMAKKYARVDYSQTHLLKSLVYFADAETQPLPKMHQPVTWDQVKKTIVSAVKAIKF